MKLVTKVTGQTVCAAGGQHAGILFQGQTRCLLYDKVIKTEGPENKSASPQRSRPQVVTEALLFYANRMNKIN